MKLSAVAALWPGKRDWASSATPGHALGKAMNIESLEHMVRNRVRIFLRNTRLVTILGTIVLGVMIWAAVHVTLAPTEMRVAAGPPGGANVKFVELLAQKLATEHDKVQLHLVSTGGPKESAAAMSNGGADLAILPSTMSNSPDWPVVTILRKNVMALIVPTQPSAAKKETGAPAKKEAGASEKKEKNAKADKNAAKAKAAKNDKGGKSAKNAKAADKSDDAPDSQDDSGSDADAGASNKLDTVSKLVNHRIAVVTGNEATRDLLDVVLTHYGVPLGQVQVSLIDPKNIADAVKTQQVDALFVAGSATGQAINEVVTAATLNGQGPSFIPIDQADGIAKRSTALISSTSMPGPSAAIRRRRLTPSRA